MLPDIARAPGRLCTHMFEPPGSRPWPHFFTQICIATQAVVRSDSLLFLQKPLEDRVVSLQLRSWRLNSYLMIEGESFHLFIYLFWSSA